MDLHEAVTLRETWSQKNIGRNRRAWQQDYGRRRRRLRQCTKVRNNKSGTEGRGNKAVEDDGEAREGVRRENGTEGRGNKAAKGDGDAREGVRRERRDGVRRLVG